MKERCDYCGQWGEAETKCENCGAPMPGTCHVIYFGKVTYWHDIPNNRLHIKTVGIDSTNEIYVYDMFDTDSVGGD